MTPKVARAQLLRESRLALFGRHSWALALPFVALAALTWTVPPSERMWLIALTGMLALLLFLLMPLAVSVAPRLATRKWREPRVQFTSLGLHIADELIRAGRGANVRGLAWSGGG